MDQHQPSWLDQLAPDFSDTSADAFTLTVAPLGDSVVVTARGELDMLTQEQLDKAVTAELSAAPVRLVLDLRGVTFVCCSSLRLLIECLRQAAARGVPCDLRPSEPITRVAKILDIAELLPH
jgi:anti-sigma B factor antagonist